jgi:hypothetical protein
MLASLLVSGCLTSSTDKAGENTPSYTVVLDGITNPNLTEWKTFTIFPMDKDVSPADLQFREYAGYVSRALLSLGYKEVNDQTNCDALILLNYGISAPEEREYSYNQPVFGQTGVSSVSTMGNVHGLSGHKVADAITGGPGFSSTTTYTPSYGITGFTQESETFVTYQRHVSFYAVKPMLSGASEADRLYWKLHIASSGSSGDLRRVFPVMIAAARDYLGKNTYGQIEVSIKDTDPKIIEIKGLSSNVTAGER